ncbi:MAG: class I SAM-dependent methyltransferase [Bacteroidetes bacterium]|nr:class I SAM-dependent methyltransferase [Bacteroidota bacterium]
MDFLTPDNWKDYELIDTGGLEKLERFGQFILARPEPQAVWKKGLTESEWESLAHARYRRQKGSDQAKSDNSEKGEWIKFKRIPDQWTIGFEYHTMKLRFRLGLTSFGHIGVFPEQALNWEFIFNFISGKITKQKEFKVLNLFAYTGGASLAAKAAGADVVHIDSSKPTLTWAREIMELSKLDGIRWVAEDALKFIRREAKRGNQYNGVILDPPSYGRGPEGEKWMLQNSIDEMIAHCREILLPSGSFMIFSLYSMGFSSLIAENLVKTHFPAGTTTETAELFFPDRSGRKLPLGTMLRLTT